MRRMTIILAAGLAALLMGCARVAVSQSQPAARHSIVYGLTLQPSGFDPHIHASSELGIPLRQVYDTLLYRDPVTREFIPGLASAWAIAPDGLSVTFTLKQGVAFHDGTPFNAAAVGANLDRITSSAAGSQRAVFLLGPYEGYEVVDDSTIRVILRAPYSPILDSFSQIYLAMASPAAFNGVSIDRYQFHQVGTGPFQFVEYIPGDRLVIRRSPTYTWGPSFYTVPTEGSIDEVVFRFYEDPPARAAALESGDADIMGELLPTDARALTGNAEIQLLPIPIPGQPLQFLFNAARTPTNNQRVRQALLLAANREAIIDGVFQRFSPLADGALSAVTPFYDRSARGVYGYDPARALTLLAEAGLVDSDDDGFIDAPGATTTVEAVEIRVLVPPWGLVPQVAALLQDQWRQIGLQVTLDQVATRGQLAEAVAGGDYHLVAFYSFGADASLLNDYWLSTGAMNWSRVVNPDLDIVLNEAARAADPVVRADLYGRVQRYLMEQALILPIRDYVNLNGARARVQNLQFDAYGWFPLLNNVTVAG